MATRINTRFLLIVFLVVASSVIVIGGLMFLRYKGDAGRNVRAGDEFMQMEDYRNAVSYYGRAVAKEPTNLQYLALMEKALLKIQPETADEAQELYRRYIGMLQHAASHAPGDPRTHLRLLEELHQAARRSGWWAYWEIMAEAAEEMREKVSPSLPEHIYASFYRGAAVVNPRMHERLSAEEIAEGENELMQFLQAVPESDEGWAILADGRLAIAQRLHLSNQLTRAEEQLQLVRETIDEARRNVTDGPEVLLVALRLKIHERALGIESDNDEELRTIVAEALRLVEDRDDPWLVASAADVVERMQWVDGLPEPAEIVEAYLAEHPQSLDLHLIQANLLYRSGELDEAEKSVQTILDAELLKTSFLSQLQFELKLRAAALRVDIAHARWLDADPADRPVLLETAIGRRDALARMVADPENDQLLIRANGKIAYAEGDYATATRHFDRLVREGAEDDPETLWYSALSLEQQGSLGLAAQRLMEALDRRPSSVALLYQASRLLLRTHQYEEAADVAATLQELAPDDEQVRRLVRAIDQALAEGPVAESLDDPILVALREARTAAQAGDSATARAVLQVALTDHPDDLRLLFMLAGVEINVGNKTQATTYIDRGLELRPQDREFLMLKAANESEDPIERAVTYAQSLHDDEARRVLQIMRTLQMMAGGEDVRAGQLAAEGREEEAARAMELAARARREAEARIPEAEALAPDDPDLIEYYFVRAVTASDWEAMAAVVQRAKELDSDQAEGMMFEARYEVARGNWDNAIRAFQRATEHAPYSAVAWRSLALAYQQVGNTTQALTAFERAHENNPNDIATIGAYAALLDRTGDKTRALLVLRMGRRVAPADLNLRHLWLNLEAQAGDPAVVLRERQRLYEEDRENRANAAALAALLGKTEPIREMLLDEEGRVLYSADRWGRISLPERRRIINQAQQEWYDRADRIVEDLSPAGERHLPWHLLRADLLRARGRIDAGETVLRQYADGLDGGEPKLLALLALGLYDAQVNRYPEAMQAYEEARQYQTDERREAHYYLAGLHVQLGQFDEAVASYESVLEDRPGRVFEAPVIDLATSHSLRMTPLSGRAIEQLIVRCYVSMREYDEARRRLEALLEDGPADYQITLLEASLVEGEADRLWVAGQTEDAERKYSEYSEILQRAESLNPRTPEPHVLRARNLMKKARRTNEPVLLDDALRALARADDIQIDSPATSMVRVEILQTMGNTRGAINELQRLLELLPGQHAARQVLVQLLLESNRPDAAIETVTEAVTLDPTSAAWREQLGDLYLTYRQDQIAAADQYIAALQSAPSSRLAAKATEALMTKNPPEFRRAIELIRQYPSQLETDPVLRINYARALVATNRFDEGREQMRLAYGALRQMIADGEQAPEMINLWFQGLRSLYTPTQAPDAEQFAMEVTGGNPDPLELRALAAFWEGTGSTGRSRAIELLRLAITQCTAEQSGILADLHGDLGTELLLAGQLPAAREAFERVLELDPDNPQVLNNLAYLLSESMGDPQRALPYAQRAVELRPGNWQVLDTLGWIYYLAGTYDQAERHLRTSIQLESAVANNLHLAYVFFKTDDLRMADRYLQRAAVLIEAESNPDPQTRAEINRLADDIRTKSRNQG